MFLVANFLMFFNNFSFSVFFLFWGIHSHFFKGKLLLKLSLFWLLSLTFHVLYNLKTKVLRPL